MRTLFIATLLISASAFSSPGNSSDKIANFSGRVGKMISNALKAADVKPTCDKNGACKSFITDFYSAEETDGCGGGTTSFDASFKYADSTEYTYRYCEGSEDQSAYRRQTNKAAELEKVLAELDYFQTRGWTSSASIKKIECSSDRQNSYSNCTVTEE